jgi:hypothetical protein
MIRELLIGTLNSILLIKIKTRKDSKVAVNDFEVTPHKLKKAIDFICVCGGDGME